LSLKLFAAIYTQMEIVMRGTRGNGNKFKLIIEIKMNECYKMQFIDNNPIVNSWMES
jgi:hypothetical protein